jgi:hypothetical protein
MRTTFFQMHLLNDTFEMCDTSFILNGKEWGEGKIEIEKEREHHGKEWEMERSRERVVTWVINLTIGQVFMRTQRRDNPRVYKDVNKAYPKKF